MTVRIRVIPCLDVRDGRVVKGVNFVDLKDAGDPVEQARAYDAAGADELCFLDISASHEGRGTLLDVVRRTAQVCFMPLTVGGGVRAVEAIVEIFPGYVQLGGGIRTPEAVEGWFELGVARVVIGTAALNDPQFVKDMAREWDGGIVVAVDARDGMVATEGWAEVSDVPVTDMARRFEDAGVASLLFTDIGRDGLLTGCNIEATVDLARRTSLPVIASGGVKGLDDIRMLAIHADEGIEGVIAGRAIYDGRLDIAAAIQMAERT